MSVNHNDIGEITTHPEGWGNIVFLHAPAKQENSFLYQKKTEDWVCNNAAHCLDLGVIPRI